MEEEKKEEKKRGREKERGGERERERDGERTQMNPDGIISPWNSFLKQIQFFWLLRYESHQYL